MFKSDWECCKRGKLVANREKEPLFDTIGTWGL